MEEISKIREENYIAELKQRIVYLKERRNAVILVHNYQRKEIQDIADILGDSFALSRAATQVDCQVIVFCGVRFMAESAYILNPHRTVLMPVKEAGCPMADMISPEKLRQKKQEYPDALVVCYVNSSAAVKAESDICCTSSNAVRITRALPNKKVIFVPDINLARYVQRQVPEKEIIYWQGFCPTHIRLTEEEVLSCKERYPEARFVAHPECSPGVLALADHICSTEGMFRYAKSSPAKEFIIGTERGMLYRLKNENVDKEFYIASENLICANMKLTTLGWVVHSLENMVHRITVDEETRKKAEISLRKMLEIG